MPFKYGINERAYGFCTDRYCEEGDKFDLIGGRCPACYDAYWDEEEFEQANSFDMYDEDYGQVPYGSMYN